MKKYLITNNYWYYDDFDFCNICIVDTREKAEELILEYNKMKEAFKYRAGYILYFEPDVELPFDINESDLHCNLSIKNIFLDIKEMQENIDKIDELQCYYEESNYFEFLSMKRSDNMTLETKLCNNEHATLDIEEIEYIN
jgi:hypothetical protein